MTAILLALSLGVVIGCGKATADVEPTKAPSPFAKVAGQWIGQTGAQNYRATIGEDGSFEISATVGEKSNLVKGSVKLEGNKVHFVATEFNGKPPTTPAEKEPATMTLSEDGVTLTPPEGPTLRKK